MPRAAAAGLAVMVALPGPLVTNCAPTRAEAVRLDSEAEHDFNVALGEAVFRRIWVSAPASTTSADGLGPLYNARACSVCHTGSGRGRPTGSRPNDEAPPSLVLRLSLPTAVQTARPSAASPTAHIAGHATRGGDPTYGLQIQTRAIQGHRSEGRVAVSFEFRTWPLAGGDVVLRQPRFSLVNPGYGRLHRSTVISPRRAPELYGLGLLAAVPEAEILAWADPHDRDGDGISGRASEVQAASGHPPALGRFGWKASTASLRRQVADAFVIDLGLSNPANPAPAGDCTPSQSRCRRGPHGGSPHQQGYEVGDKLLDLVTYFAAHVPVPKPTPGEPADAVARAGGAETFAAIGCARCHRPTLHTGQAASPHLSNRTIHPYTDLLLHDLGEGLGDRTVAGQSTGRRADREWRTAPLWGLTANGRARFLHDGRARSLEEAILWHDGEAAAARDAFAALAPGVRRRLIAFLRSL